MTAPAGRIRLHMEGVPQEMSEACALVLIEALRFCAQPETFSVFLASARKRAAGDWTATAIGRLNPVILAELEHMITAGVVADLEGAE